MGRFDQITDVLTEIPELDQIIPRCTVINIPAGATPKNIIVQLPGPDGERIHAWWSGSPSLATSDTIKLHRRGDDGLYDVLAVDADTAASSGSGAWPPDGTAMIDTTEYATFALAAAAASPGDTIKLGGGDYTCDNVSLPRDVTVIGIGLQTRLVSSTNANTLTIQRGVHLLNLTIANSYQPADSTECIPLTVDNSDEASSQPARLDGCYISGSRGTGSGSTIVGIRATSYLEVYNSTVHLLGGEVAYGIECQARITSVYNTYINMYYGAAGTVTSYGLYSNKTGAVTPFLNLFGGQIEPYSSASSAWDAAYANSGAYVYLWYTVITGAWSGAGNFNGTPIQAAGQPLVRVGNKIFRTINAAITSASAGDMIQVYPATYTEDVALSKAVTIIGVGSRDKIIITNATGTHTVIFTAAATLENLTVNNTSTTNNLAPASVGGATNTTIRNCALNKSGGATNGFGYYFAGTGHKLIDTEVNASAATNNYAVRNDTADGALQITKCRLSGTQYDLWSDRAGTSFVFDRSILVNALFSVAGAITWQGAGYWVNFTPTVTQSGAVAVTTNFCRYMVVNKIVHVDMYLSVTGSGSAGNAVAINISAVPAAYRPTSGSMVGPYYYLDSGTSVYAAIAYMFSATVIYGVCHAEANNLGITPNFAMANGDEIRINGSWRIA